MLHQHGWGFKSFRSFRSGLPQVNKGGNNSGHLEHLAMRFAASDGGAWFFTRSRPSQSDKARQMRRHPSAELISLNAAATRSAPHNCSLEPNADKGALGFLSSVSQVEHNFAVEFIV